MADPVAKPPVEGLEISVAAAELTDLRLPLVRPFMAKEGARTGKRILLLRLESESGFTGWSECVALEDPGYTDETADSAWRLLVDRLLPRIPGTTFSAPSRLLDLAGEIRDRPMAMATVEMAGWDLIARAGNVSTARLLGAGRGHEQSASRGLPDGLAVGVSLGFHDRTEELLDAAAEHLTRGYARIKVKIGPGRDREVLGALRQRFGGDLPLWADANGAYGRDDFDRVRSLDEFGLGLLEQPLPPDDLEGHAWLQGRMETSLCLDESIESRSDLESALALGACRSVNVKPGRVGGLTEAVAIHDRCVDEGIPAWVGGMLEGGVGRAHNLALATLPGFTLPGDLSESRRYFHRDIVDPPFELVDGIMPVPDGPGIGVEPDLDYVGSLATRSVRFE